MTITPEQIAEVERLKNALRASVQMVKDCQAEVATLRAKVTALEDGYRLLACENATLQVAETVATQDRDHHKAEAERLAAMWGTLKNFLSPDNTKLAHDDMPLETIEAKMRDLEAKR